MAKKIAELRILPPFAIARLGSSVEPMDNYELKITDPLGVRRIVAAETFLVDRQTGEITAFTPEKVNFRDGAGNVRPIAPFLEVWARFDGEDELVPLTTGILAKAGLSPGDLKWNVVVANIKAFRRTRDEHDKIEARAAGFSNHEPQPLNGLCKNFLDGKSIPLGFVQYIKPTAAFPEIRLRFTPAAGYVYGPPPDPQADKADEKDPNIKDAVYDPNKGTWKGYVDPYNVEENPMGMRRATNPAAIYAGKPTDDGNGQISYGYLDDECDGIVEVSMEIAGETLSAYARIAAGPPTFAPDSMPVRTVGDELEQAMFGPDFDEPLTAEEIADVREIVRRALETVRLMNTAQMNLPSRNRGVGMARMDFLDVNRALEPIVNPAVADSLAIRSRHERVLLALESGSLAWFARVLRDYDEVGDLSNEKRRKMPALMRGADGRHLALTRRQVNKVRAAAEYYVELAESIGDE
ncbi:MAG TPA: hypothetical protein VK400_00210 [Pyrinomonadaceae bacterium]|nr:hypothetical protein [Pyrinomonadaceae bacterium]